MDGLSELDDLLLFGVQLVYPCADGLDGGDCGVKDGGLHLVIIKVDGHHICKQNGSPRAPSQ